MRTVEEYAAVANAERNRQVAVVRRTWKNRIAENPEEYKGMTERVYPPIINLGKISHQGTMAMLIAVMEDLQDALGSSSGKEAAEILSQMIKELE